MTVKVWKKDFQGNVPKKAMMTVVMAYKTLGRKEMVTT
jgi:hypothetical protein